MLLINIAVGKAANADQWRLRERLAS